MSAIPFPKSENARGFATASEEQLVAHELESLTTGSILKRRAYPSPTLNGKSSLSWENGTREDLIASVKRLKGINKELEISNEINARKVTKPASSAPLGLFAFSMINFVNACRNMFLPGQSADAIVGSALFVAGLGQLIAGLFMYREPSGSFLATVFISFGLYWLGAGFLLIPVVSLQLDSIYAGTSAYANLRGIYDVGQMVFAMLITFLSYKIKTTTHMTTTILAMVSLMSLLFALSSFMNSIPLQRAGGAVGFMIALCGWWSAVASLLVDEGISMWVGVKTKF